MRTKILLVWALIASLTAWYFWQETVDLQHKVNSLEWSLNYQTNQTNNLFKKIIKTFRNIYKAIDYYGSVEEWDWWLS